MRGLDARDVIALYETGAHCGLLKRGMVMLNWALPEMDESQRWQLPVGMRDRSIMQLRALTFGSNLVVRCSCPQCDLELEGQFDLSEAIKSAPDEVPSEFEVSIDGHTASLRCPTTQDLLALAVLPIDQAATELLARCIVAVDDEPHEGDYKPDRSAMARKLSEIDPLMNLGLTFHCDACESEWEEPLEIIDFFWQELEAVAQRLLAEVHALASAYGWSESQILSLSPIRRELYLNMVTA